MAKLLPTSQAFLDKCAAENKKLKNQLALQLNTDVQNLQHSQTACDVTVTVASTTHHLHRCILEARCPRIYKSLLKASAQKRSNIQRAACDDLETILKAIYNDTNIVEVDSAVQEFVQLCEAETLINSDDEETVLFCVTLEENSLNLEAVGLQYTNCDPSISGSESVNTEASQHTFRASNAKLSEVKDTHDSGYLQGGDGDNNADPQAKTSDNVENTNSAPTGNATQDTENDAAKNMKSEELCMPSVSMLGTDLLFMYQAGLHVDIVLVASAQKFYAHRCMLIARSDYFSAMLSGGWVESVSGEIHLHGTRADVLEKMLLLIYGGLLDEFNLDLLAAADMYGIVGVKQCMIAALRRDRCHFFHKACTECIAGVIECLTLSHTFGLSDLYQHCTGWTAKYLDRVWPCKTFAQLTNEIHADCVQAVQAHMTNERFVTIAMATDKILACVDGLPWGEPLVTLTTQLIDRCAERMAEWLMSDLFFRCSASDLGALVPNSEFVRQLLTRVVTLIPLQSILSVYEQFSASRHMTEDILNSVLMDNPSNVREFEPFKLENQLAYMRYLEKCLTERIHRRISELVGTEDWKGLTTQQRNSLKAGAGYVTVGEETVTVAKPSLSNKQDMHFMTTRHKTGRKIQPNSAKTATQSRAVTGATDPTTKSQGARPKQIATSQSGAGASQSAKHGRVRSTYASVKHSSSKRTEYSENTPSSTQCGKQSKRGGVVSKNSAQNSNTMNSITHSCINCSAKLTHSTAQYYENCDEDFMYKEDGFVSGHVNFGIGANIQTGNDVAISKEFYESFHRILDVTFSTPGL